MVGSLRESEWETVRGVRTGHKERPARVLNGTKDRLSYIGLSSGNNRGRISQCENRRAERPRPSKIGASGEIIDLLKTHSLVVKLFLLTCLRSFFLGLIINTIKNAFMRRHYIISSGSHYLCCRAQERVFKSSSGVGVKTTGVLSLTTLGTH